MPKTEAQERDEYLQELLKDFDRTLDQKPARAWHPDRVTLAIVLVTGGFCLGVASTVALTQPLVALMGAGLAIPPIIFGYMLMKRP